MKRLLLFILAFVTVIAPVSGFCTDSTGQKIEQIYANMPEIQAYVKPGSETLDNFAGYMNSKKLEFSGSRPFDRQDGISFVFMFDCSTSVTYSQMSSMKKCVSDFIQNDVYENDRFVIMAFGESVDILANGENTKEEVLSAVASLKNNKNATVLFDAVNELNTISKNMDETYPKKRMGVVFTDAVDYNIGGTTKDELMEVASKTSIPLYAVAINPYNKESVDLLGQVARKSGGDVYVAKKGNIASAFEQALTGIDGLQVISFTADSNIISDSASSLRVVIDETGSAASYERDFVTNTWQKDNTAPVIELVEAISDKSVRITFSEPVDNAADKKNYTVKKGAGDRKISSVLYDENTYTATVNFEDAIGQGKYTFVVANITDHSMEKNPLTAEYEFKVTGFRAAMLSVGNFFKYAWWVIVLAVFLIAALVMLLVIKKRKGIVMLDNKATFADNIKYESTPAKPLPTKYIQFVMETADGSVTNLDINIVQSIIFGRAQSCEVTIDDTNLSRQHFAIEVEGDDLFIQNLSQTNGTFVNGIALNAKRKLCLGDEIVAGQERFLVNKI